MPDSLAMSVIERLASAHAETLRIRERAQLLSEASFEGLVFHVGGAVFDVNARLCEMLGYTREELLGDQLLSRCIVPEDVPGMLQRVADGFEGEYIVTAIRNDGSRFRAELQAKQGKLGDQPVRVVAVRDVTARERTQQLLRESEQRLGNLAQATFDITVFLRDGVIVDVSGRYEAVLGYTHGDLVGRRAIELVAEPAVHYAAKILAENRPGVFETLALAANGESIPMEVVAVQTTLDGIPTRMSAMRDLREAHKQKAERRKLEQVLEQSQRLDSLGVLAGGIAHDFNNLLTVVLGHADLLRRRLTESHDKELAQGIVDAAQRAAGLTTQMLAYAGRTEVGPRVPVDLGALVSELRTLLDATLSKKANVVLELTRASVVLGNRATLTQVVMNLLTNASDALSGEPGTIRMRTRHVEKPDARFAHALGTTVGPGRWLLLEVGDTGVGMDETTQARIFEPFFTTKAKGHGLGLAACVGIVAAHGGAILVESRPGHGSTFSVLLPAMDAPSTAHAGPRSPLRTGARTALVVDDEPLLRAQLREALRVHGFEVEEAENGKSALFQLTHHEPSVVVLDMTMPDLSGIEVLRRIRANGSRVPVILTSGYHDAALDLDPGTFQGFLSKPYTLAELGDVVERALTTR